jgi:hypothetical protein
MKNKTALTKILLFAIALLFLSCGLNPFPFDGDPPKTPNVLSKKDSLAVRAILDANGLDTVKVRDVIDLYNSSVVQINLNSRSLSQFIFNRYFDSLQSSPALNLRNNNIDTIIFTDTISKDQGISLEHNLIRTISNDVDKMRGTMALYLYYNDMTSISPNILRCNISYINVRYNHLVSVPDSIATLLTSKDGSWQSYQTP